MKILILSTKLPFPPKDGGAIATLSLAEGLADCNNEIFMLCMNTKKHHYDVNRIHPILRKKINFHAVNVDTGIRPFKAFLNLLFSDQPYNAVRFRSAQFAGKLKSLLTNHDFDIVQLEGPYMGFYIPLIRKYSEAAVALRAHNVESEIWQRKSMNSDRNLHRFYFSILSGRIKKLEENVLTESDFLVAISERDRKQLIQLSDIKSITIPTGLNPYRYPSPAEPAFPSLFYIGALDWMPNQEGILWFVEEVFPKVHAEMSNIRLHIAGRNAPEWLTEKLKNYNKKGIIYHGEVEDAYSYMNKYAVFISPLFTGSGIRIKILEGMMMQRVIVATSTAAEGLPVEDRKNILIADSVGDMTDIILDICGNREKFDHIAVNSRKFVNENFNNLATSQRLSDFYRTKSV